MAQDNNTTDMKLAEMQSATYVNFSWTQTSLPGILFKYE